jgi:hypothetical protein
MECTEEKCFCKGCGKSMTMEECCPPVKETEEKEAEETKETEEKEIKVVCEKCGEEKDKCCCKEAKEGEQAKDTCGCCGHEH